MPEPVLYIRGFPGALAEALSGSPEMLADLKGIADLKDEQIDTLRKRLSQAKGFLDPKSLRAIIREVIDDDKKVESVLRALRNLGPKSVERLLRDLSEQGHKDKDYPLDEAVLVKLRHKLPALIQPYPALSRFEKAERLAKVTGQELESVELICDLRPIFDEDRKHVEGLMPYTNLRIVATGADGLPKSFEAQLTRQQVHDLADKVSKAKVKLDVLHEDVEKWIQGGLPDLPLTRVPRKESSDA